MTILDTIHSAADVKKVPFEQLDTLAQEVRELMIQTVSKNGGHLAASLGTVEIIIALLRVFDVPDDKILYDVGHQAYAYKILTGRKDQFDSLRLYGGLSGFPFPPESPCDATIAGHAGSALSTALGMAVARDKRGEKNHIVSVVGDASIGCGISFEALNNVSDETERMLIVLNDNRMAISANVGALTRYLNRLITARSYHRLKAFVKRILAPVDRKNRLRDGLSRFTEALKIFLIRSSIFEDLGVRYVGPVDGHDIKALVQTFERVKGLKRPSLVHVYTTKGKGYKPAVENPELFHGLGRFDPQSGHLIGGGKITFSTVFGDAMCRLARDHHDVVAVTAAMTSGTGLTDYAKTFPEQFLDVGIAEEHGMICSAGMALNGLRPVYAVYATFLQRALGPYLHDVALQNLPVIVCCDRAGVVADGPTHHGIYDLGYLFGLPHTSILQPRDGSELEAMLRMAYDHASPVIIRYPKGSTELPGTPTTPLVWGKSEIVRPGDGKAVIYAVGPETDVAVEAADIIEKAIGCAVGVVNTRFLLPFDTETLRRFAGQNVYSLENHSIGNGFAAQLAVHCSACGAHFAGAFGFPQTLIPHGSVPELRQAYGLTAAQIAEKIIKDLQK